MCFLVLCSAINVWAGSREQAWRLHNRIAGVPPSPQVLGMMETYINAGNAEAAASIAMDNPEFYGTTLKNWVKAWTNADESPRVPFNDYVATVLGLVRDNVPFNQVLSADLLYIVSPNSGSTIAPYTVDSNDHYAEAESNNVNLKEFLLQRSQTAMNGIADTAGVNTTRAAGLSFYSAGTNRRVTRFTFMNYLCKDFEALHDINLSDYHVRRDVDRAPGGDSRTFRNMCVGCHSGQDALGGAFAYFDFVDGKLEHTPGQVAEKINANVLFSEGWVQSNDAWTNLWKDGQNSSLGWRGLQQGNGARSLGAMLTRSRAFSECMSQKVFKLVCLKDPMSDQEKSLVMSLANDFETTGNYSMRRLIAKTSVQCMGE
ncbi:MAG: hypothetical protein KC478_07010 [Bacteriovoracaceae bacterium]|nr:hypothetical protein [Bacteriovoracaceae bacterium]